MRILVFMFVTALVACGGQSTVGSDDRLPERVETLPPDGADVGSPERVGIGSRPGRTTPGAATRRSEPPVECLHEGVEVAIDRTDPQAMRIELRERGGNKSLGLVRLAAATRLFHWGDARRLHGDVATAEEQAALFADRSDVWRCSGQTGPVASQHPFASAASGSDLLVMTLRADYDFVAEPWDEDEEDFQSPVLSVAKQSTAARKSGWLGGLGKHGIGGIYRRVGLPTTAGGGDGEVLVAYPEAVGRVHRAGRDELLDLLANSSWTAPGNAAVFPSLAKVLATIRCEKAGASPNEVMSRLGGGPQWAWLREVVESWPGRLGHRRRQTLWAAVRQESSALGGLSDDDFAGEFCDQLQRFDHGVVQGAYRVAANFIDQMCDREDMRRREAFRTVDVMPEPL